jgi:hypothetical protein
LDLSIFSPLKGAYRKQLSNLSLMTDSTPIGKRNFLLCYQKARKASLIALNIKAGWKATGLWPFNMAKPLMSRLLLENSNNTVQPTPQDSIKEAGLVWNENISAVSWETPKKAKDLRIQAETITQLGESDLPTRRQLFRKITKGFDEKDYALTQAELRIQQLEARLEQLKPRKRQKVRTSPNSKFADIRAIKQAQIEAGDRGINEEDSDSAVDSDSASDYIEV